jgi:uncharacterized protein YjbI with pentapeptide repeats
MSSQNLNFNGKQLRGKCFRGHDLRGADFSGADIRGTDFSMANLENAVFDSVLAGIDPVYAFILSEISSLLLMVFYACYVLNLIFLPIVVCMGQSTFGLAYIISTVIIADIFPTLSLSPQQHDNLSASLYYRIVAIISFFTLGLIIGVSQNVVFLLNGYLASSLIIHSIGVMNIFVRVRIDIVKKPPVLTMIHNIFENSKILLAIGLVYIYLLFSIRTQSKLMDNMPPWLTTVIKSSTQPILDFMAKASDHSNIIKEISLASKFADQFPLLLTLYIIFSILPLGILTNFYLFESYHSNYSKDEKFNIFRVSLPKCTSFRNANLENVDFHKSDLSDTSFEKANLSGCNLSESLLRASNFQHANLSHALWLQCKDLDKTKSQGTILEDDDVIAFITSRKRESVEHKTYKGEIKYQLCGKNLTGLNLIGLDLTDVDFSDSNLSESLLRNAILTRVNLTRAILNRADLSNANLSDADLTDCLVKGANFENAILTGAILDNWKGDKDTRFWNATCSHIRSRIKNLFGSYTERREMKRGEIQSFFSNNTKVISLPFQECINWKALNYASHKFQLERNCLVRVEKVDESNQGDGMSFLVVSIPGHINEAKFRSEFDRSYKTACRSLVKSKNLDLEYVSRNIKDLIKNQANDYKYIVKLLESPRTITYQVETMNTFTDNSRNVKIRGDVNGSTVNLDRISAEVKNSVTSFRTSNDSENLELGKLLIQLQKAIEEEIHLPNEDKEDLLMQIIALTSLPKAKNYDNKNATVRNAKKIFTATLKGLPDTAKIVEACSKLLPLIFKALGFPG